MTVTSSKRGLVIPDELRSGLRNYWYPVLPADEVGTDTPVGITRLGEALVVWRDETNTVRVFKDRCAHRGAKLSIGDVVDGRLQCRYHGLQYDGTGQCRLVPIEQQEDGRQAQRLCVASYPAVEQDGAVWAYLGDVEVFPPGPVPSHDDHPELGDPTYEWVVKSMVWDANWLLIHDNTSDLFHFAYLHGHYQAVVDDEGKKLVQLPPGNPLISEAMAEVLAWDDYETTTTATSVRSRRKGDDERTIDDVEFVMPCAARVWVPLPDGKPHPVRSIQYEMALDDEKTYCVFFLGRKVDSDDERPPTRELLGSEFVWQTFSQVFREDSWITESQGELLDCLDNEHLLTTDAGPLRVRKMIHDAFADQQTRIAEHAGK